jgi:hypothetical protein
MKLATALLASLLLVGAATAALACNGAWKQTTAQNQDKPPLLPQDQRS